MNETAVYIATKTVLKQIGLKLIGGQPPNGTDSFPVIEIADPSILSKGSKGSFKPDLLAFCPTRQKIVIVECKPEFSPNDVEKLLQAAEKNRLLVLSQELRQRGFEKKHGLILGPAGVNRNQIILCVSFKGQLRAIREISQIAFSGDSVLSFKTNLEEALG
jgi:hypothetical protein